MPVSEVKSSGVVCGVQVLPRGRQVEDPPPQHRIAIALLCVAHTDTGFYSNVIKSGGTASSVVKVFSPLTQWMSHFDCCFTRLVFLVISMLFVQFS